MCLAVQGKIIAIKDDIATVDYDVEHRTGKIIEGDFKEGEYVIVQGGIVALKVPAEEAKQALALYKEAVQE